MKKLTIILLLVLVSVASFSTVNLQPGLSLSQGGCSYVIQYYNDNFETRDTCLHGDFVDRTFSYVSLHPDYYDYVGEESSPMYPAYTLHLELPLNATNVSLNVLSLDSAIVNLHHEYLPVQSSYSDTAQTICFDPTLYGDSIRLTQYYPDWYVLWNVYYRMNTRGVDFSIYPVHYQTDGTAKVLTKATFEISYTGDHIESLYTNDPEATSANYFDNYQDAEYHSPITTPVVDGDGYLIITDYQYEDSIAVFKRYKESLGYTVYVIYVDEIGNSPEDIRNQIISFYTGHHIKYVLLVGSLESIPFSSGRNGHRSDPPTDIYYTCLDNIGIHHQTELHPHVFLGRWDVNNNLELSTIMRKTIKSELGLYQNNSNRIASFSGAGGLGPSYASQAKWIKTDVIDMSSYLIGNFFDGRNYVPSHGSPSYNWIKTELEEHHEPLWMFLYFGDGQHDKINRPYDFDYNEIGNCDNHNLPYQPFGFLFADELGMLYDIECFSRNWMLDKNGGIGIMASTEKAVVECNKWFSRKMFSPLINSQSTMTIGEFIAVAKEKYYYADQVPYRRHQVEKYIYLGDPSLYIHGLDIRNNYHFAPAFERIVSEQIPSKIRVVSLDGIVVDEIPYLELEDTTYPNGVYILQTLDINNNIIDVTKKIY